MLPRPSAKPIRLGFLAAKSKMRQRKLVRIELIEKHDLWNILRIGKELLISIHPLATPRENQAAQSLLDHLNETELFIPERNCG